MANTHINRLRCVVTNTPGTSGNFVVGAAPAGRRGFSAAEDGKTFEVIISEGNAWEVRTGCVYTHSTTTVTRGTLADSSTGSAINFTSAAVVSQGLTAGWANDVARWTDSNKTAILGPSDTPVLLGHGLSSLILPPKLYATRDVEASVYFDALTLSNGDLWCWEISDLSGGIQQAERLKFVPAATLASTTISFSAIDPYTGATEATGSVPIVACSPAAGRAVSVKYLQIGDSTTANTGECTQTLLDWSAVDPFTVTLLGTQGSGSNKHEGHAGWALTDFTGSSSPFYISGGLNFALYLSNNAIAMPDWVGIMLGTNDMLAVTSDATALSAATSAFNGLDVLMASIKAAGVSIKIALMPIPMPSSDQDGFGENYGTGISRWRYKRNAAVWNRALYARYSGQEAARVYICPAPIGYDNNNNALFGASGPMNARSAISKARHNNGVHPATGGYQQIGDGIWAFLKCQQSDTSSTYSAELITNGGFASDTVWSKGDGWTISGGVGVASSCNTAISNPITAYPAGAVFLVTYTIKTFTAGQCRAAIGGAAGAWQYAAGKVSELITTANSGSTFDFYGASSFSGTIDDVSVRRVT